MIPKYETITLCVPYEKLAKKRVQTSRCDETGAIQEHAGCVPIGRNKKERVYHVHIYKMSKKIANGLNQPRPQQRGDAYLIEILKIGCNTNEKMVFSSSYKAKLSCTKQ
jgi:hypothetical protein